MIHEEKEYWKGFPRKIEFYHWHLRIIIDIAIEKMLLIPGSVNSVKDFSLIITNILNILPVASRKYCAQTGIDPVLHNDKSNKTTFDSIVENIVMFNADGMRNWQLLGFTVTLLCSDLILMLLELINTGKEFLLSPGVIDILLEICKHYSIV